MSRDLNLVMLGEISDDTDLVRFVDKNGIQHSVGKFFSEKLHYKFPIQLSSYFKKCESVSGDPSEGNTRIYFGEGRGSGNVATCNDSLISSWSVCTNTNDPWESLSGSAFSINKIDYPYAILTTVGAVKKQMRILINEINKKCVDANGLLIMNAIYGLVSYYPIEGLPLDEWKIKDDIKLGVDITTILNIFHKPVQNKNGQRYDAEKECRFALILNVRDFRGVNGELISGEVMASQLIYFPLVNEDGLHYIKKVYTYVPSNNRCQEISLDDVMNTAEIT